MSTSKLGTSGSLLGLVVLGEYDGAALEAVTADKWMPRTNQRPLPLPPRLATYQAIMAPTDREGMTAAEVVRADKFQVEARTPRWAPRPAPLPRLDYPSPEALLQGTPLAFEDQFPTHPPARVRLLPRRPIVLPPIAGEVDDLALLVQEAITVDKFQAQTRTPRWARRPLVHAPAGELDLRSAGLAELLTVDKWYSPLSPPRWDKPRWPQRHTPGSSIEAESVFPPDPAAFEERAWEVALSLPVLPRYRAARYPYGVLQLDQEQQAELVLTAAFLNPLALPDLVGAKRLRDTHRLPCAFLELDEAGRPEVVSLASLDAMAIGRLPVKALRGNGLGSLVIDPTEALELIRADKWYTALSVPVLPRRAPNLPWTVALGEHYLRDLFRIPVVVFLNRPMLSAGMFQAGF